MTVHYPITVEVYYQDTLSKFRVICKSFDAIVEYETDEAKCVDEKSSDTNSFIKNKILDTLPPDLLKGKENCTDTHLTTHNINIIYNSHIFDMNIPVISVIGVIKVVYDDLETLRNTILKTEDQITSLKQTLNINKKLLHSLESIKEYS
jgi:hypothetical protein